MLSSFDQVTLVRQTTPNNHKEPVVNCAVVRRTEHFDDVKNTRMYTIINRMYTNHTYGLYVRVVKLVPSHIPNVYSLDTYTVI